KSAPEVEAAGPMFRIQRAASTVKFDSDAIVCTSCKTRKGKASCAHRRCVSCCMQSGSEDCVGHAPELSKKRAEDALLLEAQRGSHRRVPRGMFKEEAFEEMGETLVIFGLRLFLSNRAFSQEVLDKQTRSKRALGGRHGMAGKALRARKSGISVGAGASDSDDDWVARLWNRTLARGRAGNGKRKAEGAASGSSKPLSPSKKRKTVAIAAAAVTAASAAAPAAAAAATAPAKSPASKGKASAAAAATAATEPSPVLAAPLPKSPASKGRVRAAAAVTLSKSPARSNVRSAATSKVASEPMSSPPKHKAAAAGAVEPTPPPRCKA
ncbi:unnamed protein product, partial [Phaeothamnion confervicola]